MFCQQCGSEVPAGAVVCPSCGAKVQQESGKADEIVRQSKEATRAFQATVENFQELYDIELETVGALNQGRSLKVHYDLRLMDPRQELDIQVQRLLSSHE